MYVFAQSISIQEDIAATKEIISSVPLFDTLNATQIQSLLSLMHVRCCQQNDYIFSAGDLPLNIYIVLSGQVNFMIEFSGVRRIQGSYKRGDMFGEFATKDKKRQIGTAIASTNDVELLVLSRKVLNNLLIQDSELFTKLMTNIRQTTTEKTYLN